MDQSQKNRAFRGSKKIEFLIFLSVFISSITFFKYPFEGYLHYAVFLLLLPFFIFKFGIPKFIVKILGFLFIVGSINVILGNSLAFSFIKVFGGFLLSVLFYYYVYLYYNKDVTRLFEVYLKWAYWSAVIGLFQLASFLVGFRYGYDFGWILNKWGVIPGGLLGIRINSIFPEPSQLAIVLAPAAYVGLYNLLHKTSFVLNKVKSFAILLAIILSASSTGYIGILLAFLLASNSIRLRYIIFGLLISVITFNIFYSNVSEFKTRVDAAVALWVYQDFDIENTNTSSFVLYNNYHITMSSFSRHPIFGTGLGSHEVSYDKYSYTNNMVAFKEGFSFNKSDANSMFLRLLSETGLIGVGFFILVLIRGYVGQQKQFELENYRIVSKGLLVIIILYLLRQGNYFLNGFPLFVIMYYFNKVNYRKDKQRLIEQIESAE